MLGQLMEGESKEESEEMADGNPDEEMSEKPNAPRAEQAIIAKLAQENAALAERVKAVEQERAQERANALVEAGHQRRAEAHAQGG